MSGKVKVFGWHFNTFEDKTGLMHLSEYPKERVLDLAQKVLDSGLNIMIVSEPNGIDCVLYIDDGYFGQK